MIRRRSPSLELVDCLRLGGAPRPLALALLATIVLSVLTLESPASEVKLREILFLIDVSGSMVGLPPGSGNADIFPEMLKPIIRHVRTDARLGDTIHIFTFADGPHAVDRRGGYPEFWSRKLVSEQDREAAVRYVEGLNQAMRRSGGAGSRTAIRDSAATALRRLQEFQDRYPEGKTAYREKYDQLLVLFTDGKDNVSKVSPEEIARRFDLLRSEEYMGNHILWAYYALQNAPIPPDLPPGVVAASGIPERFIYVSVEPGSISFGSLGQSVEARQASLRLHSQGEFGPKALTVTSTGPQLPSAVSVTVVPAKQTIASEDRELKLSLNVTNPGPLLAEAESSQQDKTYKGELALSVADPLVRLNRGRVSFSFNVAVPKWVKITLSEAGSLPLDLGTLREKAEAGMPLEFEFSKAATAGKASLGLRILLEPNNPAPLVTPDLVGIATKAQRMKEMVAGSDIGPIRLAVAGLEESGQAWPKAGHYRGVVEIEPSPADLEIRVVNRHGKPLPLAEKRIAFQFTVPKAPWGPLAKSLFVAIPILLVGGAGLVVLASREKRKILRGKVIHLGSDGSTQQVVDFDTLSLKVCRFGGEPGAEFSLAGNIEAKMYVRLAGGRPGYVLESNGPHIQLAGKTDRVSKVELFNRDSFTIGADQFEYRNPGALQRGGR